MSATHQVFNQAPPRIDVNEYTSHTALVEAVGAFGGGWATDALTEAGALVGRADFQRDAELANTILPKHLSHDRWGNRIDDVEFHPAYHSLMRTAVTNGVHALPYERPPGDGARVVRDALMWSINQVEPAHTCPISMTTSVIPALRTNPELAAQWEPHILARTYDPELGAVGVAKRSALMGMGMTEKQGGSDVRANTSQAVPVGGAGDEYLLTGHKWFTSAPMCDGFLVLAQAPGGLTCFLLPRVLPDGSRNTIEVQRLKDKLGNRANASSELEFREALMWRVGDEGRGVATIIEMVNGTRLDCVIGVVGQMRQAVHQAAWHTAHRSAFGGLLADKPLMHNVLADLELDVEAATLLMMRVSGSFDRAATDPAEAAFRRIATPVAKYWATKMCTGVVREAMECLGGNGYVEESILPRLFRESPLNAIWEGSGNVIALDVLRALAREPGAADSFVAELRLAAGADRRLDAAIDAVAHSLVHDAGSEPGARILVERMALVWAASLLTRYAPAEVADAFVASRVAATHGPLYGTLPPGLPLAALAARAHPGGAA